MKILILRNTITRLDENNMLFANEFLERGDEVYFGLVNSVSTHDYVVYADIVPCHVQVELDGSIQEKLSHQSIEGFDLIWVMNQPHPNLSRDVWQILWMLSKRVPFVNSVEAMMFLNTKNTLGYLVPQEHLVENHVANSYDTLWNIYSSRKDERWVLKPTNGGCGADVFILDANGSNTRALVQSATGNTTASTEITDGNLIGLQNKFTIMQKFAPEVTIGEKRVIIAGGEVITSHGRTLAEGDHRSNITQGGAFFASDLTPEEHTMCAKIGERLIANGVGYIGLDISYPYVLEFNIVNPGGMYDAMLVTGTNMSSKAVDRILAARLPQTTR